MIYSAQSWYGRYPTLRKSPLLKWVAMHAHMWLDICVLCGVYEICTLCSGTRCTSSYEDLHITQQRMGKSHQDRNTEKNEQ